MIKKIADKKLSKKITNCRPYRQDIIITKEYTNDRKNVSLI